ERDIFYSSCRNYNNVVCVVKVCSYSFSSSFSNGTTYPPPDAMSQEKEKKEREYTTQDKLIMGVPITRRELYDFLYYLSSDQDYHHKDIWDTKRELQGLKEDVGALEYRADKMDERMDELKKEIEELEWEIEKINKKMDE